MPAEILPDKKQYLELLRNEQKKNYGSRDIISIRSDHPFGGKHPKAWEPLLWTARPTDRRTNQQTTN
jgi:hypothetical protein